MSLPWSWGFCCERALESLPSSFPQCSPTLFDVCPISMLLENTINKRINSVKEEKDGAILAKRFHISCLKQTSQTQNLPGFITITGSITLFFIIWMSFFKSTQRALVGELWNVNVVNSCGPSVFIICTEAQEGQQAKAQQRCSLSFCRKKLLGFVCFFVFLPVFIYPKQ